MKYRKILSIILGIVLILTAVPLEVFAADAVKYDLWVNGTQFTSANAKKGITCGAGKATYDIANKMLTLDNAEITSAYSYSGIFSTEVLIINLAKDSVNTIDLSKIKQEDYSFGIYSAKALNIAGTGTLNIISGKAAKDSYGIYVKTGALNIAGGTLSVKSGKAETNSMSICVLSEENGNMKVYGTSDITCTNTSSLNTRGIYVNGSFTAKDSARVTVTAASATGANSYGMRINKDFTMSGSSYIKTTAGKATDFSIGLYVLDGGEGISVKGGSLYAYSASGAKNCEAVYSKNFFRVSGGKVTAKSGTADVEGGISYAVNTLDAVLSGGTVKLTTSDADDTACGLFAYSLKISGKNKLTVSGGKARSVYSLGCSPEFASYIPMLTAGDSAPGSFIANPTMKDYTSSKYISIERKIKSTTKWYALTVFDKDNTLNNSWVTFDMGTVDQAKAFCLQYGSTIAAEYYNGRVYGIEDNMPYRLWVSDFDGSNFTSFNKIGKGLGYEIGDISFNYKDNKMYAIGNINMRRALFTIDLAKGTAEKVEFITGTEASLLTLAIDNEGNAYGIDEKGVLYSVNLKTAQTKAIGSTGLPAEHVQSMAFDRDTGELFWARYSSLDEKSGIYYVDIKNASVTKIDVAGGRTTELAALFMAPASYGLCVGGTPVTPLNQNDLYGNGKVSFDPETLTLTLNSVKISTCWKNGTKESYGIYSSLSKLNIVLNGENAITMQGSGAETAYGIASKGKVEITGGKLTVVLNDSSNDCSIFALNGLTVNDSKLILISKANGIAVSGYGSGFVLNDSEVTISTNKRAVEVLHGNIDLNGSSLSAAGDKAGNGYGTVYAEYDITADNSSLVATSVKNSAVNAGGTILLKYSKFEAAGANIAFRGDIETADYDETAILTNMSPKYDGYSPWNNVTPLTKYKYVSIFPCTHKYTNSCDSECNWCGHHRNRTHDFPGELSHDSKTHYYQCTKCGEKQYEAKHEWKFVKLTDGNMELYKCFCGEQKKEKHFYMTGDADNSGDVTAADARIALRICVGLEEYGPDDKTFTACDIDLNGSVDTGEARKILRAAVGLEKLPER